MSTLLIEGGRRLSGRITVDGNKNSALPLVAACLLSDETCRLENVPRISDIRVMADLLTGLGARVSGLGTPTLEISTPTVTSDTPDPKLVGRLRGSVLLMGPLLARTGRVCLAPPGGDFPTRRTIATHVQALVALGARVDLRVGLRAGRARRAARRLVLSRRGVGHRHRDGACSPPPRPRA